MGTDDFDEVFRASYPTVTRTVYLVTGDWEVAREVAQDAFVQLLRHWRKVGRYDNPGAWARRVAIRMAVRERKRRSRPVPVLVPRAVDDVDGALDLRRAVLALAPAQRAAVSLHYLAGMPVSEVADALGCTPSTARTHLQRARERLAGLLEETDDEAR